MIFALLVLRRRRARITLSCVLDRKVQRCRATLVPQPHVGAVLEEGANGRRGSRANRSMEGSHATVVAGIRVRAAGNQVLDDRVLCRAGTSSARLDSHQPRSGGVRLHAGFALGHVRRWRRVIPPLFVGTRQRRHAGRCHRRRRSAGWRRGSRSVRLGDSLPSGWRQPRVPATTRAFERPREDRDAIARKNASRVPSSGCFVPLPASTGTDCLMGGGHEGAIGEHHSYRNVLAGLERASSGMSSGSACTSWTAPSRGHVRRPGRPLVCTGRRSLLEPRYAPR